MPGPNKGTIEVFDKVFADQALGDSISKRANEDGDDWRIKAPEELASDFEKTRRLEAELISKLGESGVRRLVSELAKQLSEAGPLPHLPPQRPIEDSLGQLSPTTVAGSAGEEPTKGGR